MFVEEKPLKLPAYIWPELVGRLWHATHIDKAVQIVADGHIKPDAAPTYRTGYCRSKGGISLFDFREPEATVLSQMGNWTRWLNGHASEDQEEVEIGVWFDIDPVLVVPHIAASDIYAQWGEDRLGGSVDLWASRDPLPHCEACHIGAIPLDCARGVLLIDSRREERQVVPNDADLLSSIEKFRAAVLAKSPLEPSFAGIFRAALRKSHVEPGS